MKRITRDRTLQPSEAAKYSKIREEITEELPELLARQQERNQLREQLAELVRQLKTEREAQGLSLADLMARTGMDRSAISKLETGQRPNPTVDTLLRYAQAVGKQLVLSLHEHQPATKVRTTRRRP